MTRRNYVIAISFGVLAVLFIMLPRIQSASADWTYCYQNLDFLNPGQKCTTMPGDPPAGFGSGGAGGGSETPVKSMKKRPKTIEGPPPDLSQLVQQCGFVHMDYVGSRNNIPYSCTQPTVAMCGSFDRDTKLAKCCCVAPGYTGRID
jgi:hypothetical protein